MASKKFNKGSEEWMMFTDFWNLCQKYWIVEDTDEYWESVISSTNEFYEKYNHILLSRRLALAFIDAMEDVFKKRGDMSGEK